MEAGPRSHLENAQGFGGSDRDFPIIGADLKEKLVSKARLGVQTGRSKRTVEGYGRDLF